MNGDSLNGNEVRETGPISAVSLLIPFAINAAYVSNLVFPHATSVYRKALTNTQNP